VFVEKVTGVSGMLCMRWEAGLTAELKKGGIGLT